MSDFCVNDVVVVREKFPYPYKDEQGREFDQQDRIIIGVVEEIDNEKQQARIKTIEGSVGSLFESYLFPLSRLKRFNLAFFEQAEKSGHSGYYYELRAKKARLQTELYNTEKSLKDITDDSYYEPFF